MYLPEHFAETDAGALQNIIHAYPLGALVTQGPTGLDANHLPFLYEVGQRDGQDTSQTNGAGVLLAHVARANTLWQEVEDGAAVLVIFRGAQGYISPNWYPGKQETHRRVPTWAYEVVHAHGHLHIHDDEKFVRRVVARLTQRHEAMRPPAWKMGDAPPDYLVEQLRNIVGLEVKVTRLEGKRKLNQNHGTGDRAGAIKGLQEEGNNALAQAFVQLGGG